MPQCRGMKLHEFSSPGHQAGTNHPHHDWQYLPPDDILRAFPEIWLSVAVLSILTLQIAIREANPNDLTPHGPARPL